MAANKRGLGRGLDTLLGNLDSQQQAAESELQHIALDLICRGKYQPRREMEPQALQELADSIRVQGVIQPIMVRPVEGDHFEIIAGERRWRASLLAGLEVIPAIVRDTTDQTAIAVALIENIQRENLNAIEEAVALKRLQEEFDLTQQQTAEAVGKSRATVANLIRLLSLNSDVKELLLSGELDMGHARALLALSGAEQSRAARRVVSGQLSVRQTESLVKKILANDASENTAQNTVDPDISRLEQTLAEQLGSPVSIQHGTKGRGKLVIKYNSAAELEGILAHIK